MAEDEATTSTVALSPSLMAIQCCQGLKNNYSSEESEVSSEVMPDISGEVDQAVDEVLLYLFDALTPTVSLKMRLQ